jgi:beta-N-acetylhexosaminidase
VLGLAAVLVLGVWARRSDDGATSRSKEPSVTSERNEVACGPAPRTPPAKAAYVVMTGYGPGDIADAEASLSSDAPPAGIFVNADIDAATGRRLAALQRTRPILVAIDEEGGRVMRIEHVAGSIPSAAVQAASGADLRQLGRRRGSALIANGINVDFAPVVDLRAASSDSVIGDRSYGSDPDVVDAKAGAFAMGLRDAKVLPTLKHFPGHGHASGDSHEGAVDTPPIDQMSADLAPFRTLARQGRVAIMVGHLLVPGLSGGEPTSVSPATYALLRKTLKFDGLVVTDDLGGMSSITDSYTSPEAGVAAIKAGADIALFHDAKGRAAIVAAVADAVTSGEIPSTRVDAAVRHIRGALRCA